MHSSSRPELPKTPQLTDDRRVAGPLAFQVECNGTKIVKFVPLVLGIIGNFSGIESASKKPLRSRKFVSICRDNFESVMQYFNVSLSLRIADGLTSSDDGSEVKLTFQTLDDFQPDAIVRQIKILRELSDQRDRLSEVLRDWVEENRAPCSDHDDSMTTAILLENWIPQNLALDGSSGDQLQKVIDGINCQIDCHLSPILRHPDLLQLESSWRGLHYLVMNSQTSKSLKIRVLDCTKKELMDDFSAVEDFDLTALFRKVYEEEFNFYGGEPYCALIGDFEFSLTPSDIQLLNNISLVSEAAFCPFISAVTPDVLAQFDLLQSPELGSGLLSAAWQSFRSAQNSRFVVLTTPRVPARTMALSLSPPNSTVWPSEDSWVNAAYMLAARISTSFSTRYRSYFISGIDTGGLVDFLPPADRNEDTCTPGVSDLDDFSLTLTECAEINKHGLTVFNINSNRNYGVFFRSPTCHRPEHRDESAATELNAEIMISLPYILAVSEFARLIRVISRDKYAPPDREGLQRELRNWITTYVYSNAMSDELRSAFPLAEASINVEENRYGGGMYVVQLSIRPNLPGSHLTTVQTFNVLVRITW